MIQCKTCQKQIQTQWNYCPHCGTKTKIIRESSKLDSSKIRLDRVKYHWERQHGGKVVYENFESVKEVGYPYTIKKIRQKLGNFSNMNMLNLRLFSFLYFKPDYLSELMKIYKSYGYYSAYFTTKNTKIERYIGSDIDDEAVWRDVLNKTMARYYRDVFKETKTALPDRIYANYRKKIFVVEAMETASSLLKSNKPLCVLEIASTCGPLEVMSNSYWNGREVECAARGDKKCKLVMYPSKTEDFKYIPKLTASELKDLINQSLESILKRDTVKRKKLGNMLHIFDDQLLNYYLINLSPGHNILSKYSGFFVGEKLIEKSNIEELKDILDYLIDFFNYMKVGLLTIKSKTSNKIELLMEESVYSSGIKNINMKLDTFIAGIIEGALNKATNQKWLVEETKCLANGDNYCEFICKNTQH